MTEHMTMYCRHDTGAELPDMEAGRLIANELARHVHEAATHHYHHKVQIDGTWYAVRVEKVPA